MIIDFAFYLTVAVLLTGTITLIDRFWLRKRRGVAKLPLWVEYARAFFPVLVMVWVIRSFVVQPYRVPSGSLEPTVKIGDFIAAEQFSYGLRIPVINKVLIPIGEPKRGDITLFHWPKNPKILFVKRVIGLPGDHIGYKNKVLYINGKKQTQRFLGKAHDRGVWGYKRLVNVEQENLNGVKHQIYLQADGGGEPQDIDVTVPPGHYFMMGDNRDNSDDSRQWGFVPEGNLVGKAFGVWMSWDGVHNKVRWDRIGHSLT